MKTKVLFLLTFTALLSMSSYAQRAVRIGYIDTEYILQNVPEYQDATSQLDNKVQKWKSEIEKRLIAVEQKKKQLDNERVLLTKELAEERQEEITVEENEILDYQHKRFGPNGDLVIQKRQLMQPVQDQIFTAVREIAANKKYDFIFDKSADVVMLYSADRFDISEQVLRSITRSSKRRQVSNKAERKAAEAEEVVPEVNEVKDAREQAVEDKKIARDKIVADRRAQQQAERDAKKQALEDKKKKILEDRAKANEAKIQEREGGTVAAEAGVITTKGNTPPGVEAKSANAETQGSGSGETAAKSVEKPLSDKEQRKKDLEDKKKKILAERKARAEEKKRVQDSIKKAKENNDN